MEEKRTLSNAEIARLNTQYYDLTEDLKQYRRFLRIRYFKKELQEKQESLNGQYHFFKSALNGTLKTLIVLDGLNRNVAIDSLFNRFVSFKTKLAVSKYLRNYKSKK